MTTENPKLGDLDPWERLDRMLDERPLRRAEAAVLMTFSLSTLERMRVDGTGPDYFQGGVRKSGSAQSHACNAASSACVLRPLLAYLRFCFFPLTSTIFHVSTAFKLPQRSSTYPDFPAPDGDCRRTVPIDYSLGFGFSPHLMGTGIKSRLHKGLRSIEQSPFVVTAGLQGVKRWRPNRMTNRKNANQRSRRTLILRLSRG